MVAFNVATQKPPSLPSRASAQVRVGRFVVITCSVPNHSCDLYKADSRTGAQLVSSSRDPIGYEEGMHMQCAYFALKMDSTDPLGLKSNVDCWVTAWSVCQMQQARFIIGPICSAAFIACWTQRPKNLSPRVLPAYYPTCVGACCAASVGLSILLNSPGCDAAARKACGKLRWW